MRELTLAGALDASADRFGERPAAIQPTQAGTRVLSYGALRDQSRRAAGALAARGVGRGDVVGVWLANCLEYLVIEHAVASLGAAVLGINTRYGPHDVAHLLRTGRPVGVVVPGRLLERDFSPRLRDAVAGAASEPVPWVSVVGPSDAALDAFDVGAGAWAFGPAVDAGEPVAATGRPSDVVNYFTTSGSTGRPKLAGHDQRAVVRHAANVAAALDLRPGDVVLGVLPLSGVFGFNPAMAALSRAGAVLLTPVFDAAATLDDMARFGVTHALGGDDLFGRLMDAWEANPVALPAFRRGGIADFEGRSRRIAEWAERELSARISGLYGSSELFAVTAIWPESLAIDARLRAGGLVVSDEIEVRAVDAETGAPCAPGEVGELQFRGYNVLTEYRGNPEAAQEAFTPDGWFRSSDLGSLTAEPGGFVYLCRSDDALRLRGFLVEPAEIEAFLMSHPQVDTAKVVGVRDERGAQRAVAYATLRPAATIDAQDLTDHCRGGLAAFKVPSAITVIPEFPVTTSPNGTKIRTVELRRWAEAQLRGEQPGERIP